MKWLSSQLRIEQMKELKTEQLSHIQGGLAFLPLLAVSAAGSFAGGHIAGKIVKYFKE
jgi:bacteriocin-like protein